MADGSGPIITAGVASLNAPHRKKTVVGFAGGGGSSIAIKQALGLEPDAGLNHWPLALQVHLVNFRHCEFHLADITETDPRTVLPGEPIGLLWLSPDCRHFSKAKGGAPVSPRVRGLAWVALPWAVTRRPDVIMLENVEEFLTWGPVGADGQPVPALKGTTFARWKARLEKIGYVVDHRVISAADFGAPTIRKRLFLIARCDGLPIVWPEATHAPRHSEAVTTGRLLPYASAASIIDWSRPCPSIFLTPEEARALRVKRPLQPATLKRIAKGLLRYTIASADPFIVSITHQGGDRSRSMREPLATITTAHRGEAALISPVLTGCGGRMGQTEPPDPRDPYPTLTAKNDSCLAAAYLQTMSENGVGSHPTEPIWAAMAQAPRHYLVEAEVEAPIVLGASHGDGRERAGLRAWDMADPVRTISGERGGFAVASAHLVPRYSEREGQAPRAHDVGEPSTTIPGQLNVVAAFMEQANTGMVGHEARSPLSTTTGRGTQQRLVAAQLSHAYTSNTAGGESDPRKPLKTVTAGGNHAYALESVLAPSIQAYYSSGSGLVGHDAADPAPTVTSTDRLALTEARLSPPDSIGPRETALRAFLAEHYGAPTAEDLADPLGSIESRSRLGLVVAHGTVYRIVDIGMRMLDPETELAAAMGVPKDYILNRDTAGQRITKTDITKMVGNMVSPPPARALIAANCGFLKAEAAHV